MRMINKINAEHIKRKACIYIRQSTTGQVIHHRESQLLQYGLVERAKELGWNEENIRVIDSDLGTTASGCVDRKGFQDLLSSVCEGKTGAIFSIEVSRLARNGREWHTLLEICAFKKTVLVDQGSIYDLSLINDRLLLGLKGEMSTMELSLLRERSQAAIQQKAKRGELYLTIPAAYIKTRDNKLKKNPDKRIQEVTELVFTKFKEYGTVRQVCKWFSDEKIEIAVVSNGKGKRRIEWKLPATQTLSRILNNPIYAGAYAYGRTKTEVEYKDERKKLRKGIRKCQKDWDVLIFNHHEGYISWEEYQYNIEILAQNMNKKRPVVKGSVRGGKALLGSLLRCGHCGRKLLVRYQGRNGSHKRYVCSSKQSGETEKKACISFGGFRVDSVVAEYLLKVLSSMGLEASLKAIKDINNETDSVKRQRELELEQARYESLLAKRQYNAVDPENRLVASTLEKDWNDALVKVARLENEIITMLSNTPPLSPEEEAEIRGLSQDLPRVWNDPSISLDLKKRIIRTVIKEIVVYLEDQKIKLIIHWEGDDHTELEVLKNKSSEHPPLKTDVDIKKIISGLARIMPDKHIVAFLNRMGKKTAKGHNWNPVRLRSFRNKNDIPVYREGERQEREEYTVDEASEKLGIGNTKVWRLIQHKILPARQVCPGAPWIIYKKDLESEVTKKAAYSKLSKRPLSENSKQKVFNFQ
jgi:DNA invertase Pin-like site-specific DNA recombinase